MAVLARELRKTLENVVAEARNVAEEAAQKALRALAVGDREPHRSMTEEQEALRNRLRAHGRQLGDARHADRRTQELDHLVAECAYEHWHRMLFARFLAENQLLLEPESGVAIAIDEVKEMARTRGKDWVVLAGEFAVQMLPQVFRQDDPVLEVEFAPEDRRRLEEFVEGLSVDVFTASDSLGWTYQFWQAERKDAINASGEKIGADELPAVTQLFTEDYMVDFLLDNTLGAWHASKELIAHPQLAETSPSEEELRKAVALPGSPWAYLRFIKGTDGKWTPAAGTFHGWPRTAKELKCLDPCMGSGHFVVAMFERLVALRLAEEKLDDSAAVAAVIRDNLFGLEIDPRCTQICAFNLALAAWRRVGHRQLPSMNLACSGLGPNAGETDWLAIAGGNQKLQRGMERLHRLFQKATVLGSLINPSADEGDLLVASFHELQPLLEKALAREINDAGAHELTATAHGLARAAEILADKFTLIATNVPYLGRPKQDSILMDYCERVHPDAKADLATCFVERCLQLCSQNGTTALVTPQNWLFLDYYKVLRKRLLKTTAWSFVARLGPGCFETISGEVVKAALVCLSQVRPEAERFLSLDVSTASSPKAKANELHSSTCVLTTQANQLGNPDARVTHLTTTDTSPLLLSVADAWQGLATGDFPRLARCFWELRRVDDGWEFIQESPDFSQLYGGRQSVLLWQDGGGGIAEVSQNPFRGKLAWNKPGVAVSVVGDLSATLYTGEIFSSNVSAVTCRDTDDIAAIWMFCSSPEFLKAVRRLDQKMMVTNATLTKVPFDRTRWQNAAAEKYPHGLPKPFSSDPAQWLFNGRPASSDWPLHVAVARLLGYQWPRQTGSSFLDSPALDGDGLEEFADDDGIVPISAAKGEASAAERLRELLTSAYGRDWNSALQGDLLTQVNYTGASLDDWLRDGFFEHHCTLFQRRPFVWHIWDGEPDGFHTLVNYHTLVAPDGGGRKALEKLSYAYLGDWIGRQKAEQRQGKEGADAKLSAALHLQAQLKKIIEGEPPFDLFVRWKPLHEQAIGWEPDINDGVRVNIRPFMMAETLKGKSIFRKAPKIKWEKDRGKEPERPKRDFPWFWSWDEETQDFAGGREFDGNRWNDVHYSNKTKQEARTLHEESGR